MTEVERIGALIGRALNCADAAEQQALKFPVNTLDYRMCDAVRIEALELFHALDCGGRMPFPDALIAYAARLGRAEALLCALGE